MGLSLPGRLVETDMLWNAVVKLRDGYELDEMRTEVHSVRMALLPAAFYASR